ncbi:MAG: hypothetical protein AB7H93_13440 [Vicinamibacterales bacterium]
MDASAPTVLWRLRHGEGAQARAVLLPGTPQHTLTVIVDEVMDRAENFDSLEVALFRAEDLRATLLAGGWREEVPR